MSQAPTSATTPNGSSIHNQKSPVPEKINYKTRPIMSSKLKRYFICLLYNGISIIHIKIVN